MGKGGGGKGGKSTGKVVLSLAGAAIGGGLFGAGWFGSRVYVYKILYPDSLSDPSQITILFYGSIDSPELTNEGTFKIQLVSDIPTATGGRILQYPCNSTFGD